MSTPIYALALAAAIALLAGGCARETLREMGSLKDGLPPPAERHSAGHERAERMKTAVKPGSDEDAAETQEDIAETEKTREGESEIETGSVSDEETRPANCQGAHVAYQATRQYLKNFGPRPQDLPGEKGPCLPNKP